MGRAKLKMELIEKEKSRNTTFKKRKEGLIRKVHEFTTLCDVNACMIIYQKQNHQPEIWPPQNPDQVRRIIDIYKSKNTNKNSGIKTFGVVDFFHDRKKQIEEEVAKLRRKNLEAKYPTRPDLLNVMTESQLRQFHALLINKADHVRSRIELLRRNNPPIAQSHRHQQQQAVEMLIDHHRLQQVLNHNSMMMQFEGGSTSANIQLKRQVFFETASGYYAPPSPPPLPLQPYMVTPPTPYMLPAVVPPQLQYFANRDCVQEELIQYQMRNQTARNQNEEGEYDDQELVVNRFFSY